MLNFTSLYQGFKKSERLKLGPFHGLLDLTLVIHQPLYITKSPLFKAICQLP